MKLNDREKRLIYDAIDKSIQITEMNFQDRIDEFSIESKLKEEMKISFLKIVFYNINIFLFPELKNQFWRKNFGIKTIKRKLGDEISNWIMEEVEDSFDFFVKNYE